MTGEPLAGKMKASNYNSNETYITLKGGHHSPDVGRLVPKVGVGADRLDL